MVEADEWLQGRVASIDVEGRTKSVHSTWRKMQRRELSSIASVHDLLALRIVVHPRPSCATDAEESALAYHILGKLHGCWTPMPRTLKDYISAPKPNGYRALHTTVLVGLGVHEAGAQPLEIQIKTATMHAIAEHGAAAHWAYKVT